MRRFAEIVNHSRDFVEEVVSSRFWHEEKARDTRERNVDILNKTYYESGIWSAIWVTRRNDGGSEIPVWPFFFFLNHAFCSDSRYRLLVIISPVSLSAFYN